MQILNLPIFSNIGLLARTGHISVLEPQLTIVDGLMTISHPVNLTGGTFINANNFNLIDDDNTNVFSVTDEGIFIYGQLTHPNPYRYN